MQQDRSQQHDIELAQLFRQILGRTMVDLRIGTKLPVAEPEPITDTADVLMELSFSICPPGLPAARQAHAFIRYGIPEPPVHGQFNCDYLAGRLFDLEGQKPGGRADFKHTLAGEVITAEILAYRLAQVPLPLDRSYPGNIGGVIEVAVPR